jgi:hypothetical protein
MQIHIYRYRTPRWLRALAGALSAVLIALVVLLVLVCTGIGHAQALPGVRLEWDYTQSPDPNAQADSFVIQRCQGANCTTFADLPIPAIPVATRTYLDTAVTAGTTYRWRVMAKGPGGLSAPSSAVTFLVPTPPVAPVAPTNLRGTWQP